MFSDPMMKMKKKQEMLHALMNENDQHEGMKLKPKAAVISVTKVEPVMHGMKGPKVPGMKDSMDTDPAMAAKPSMPSDHDGDELGDDDLKKLMNHYMGG